MELLIETLLKIRQGSWYGTVENSWKPENNITLGPFRTKDYAQDAADIEAKSHNDSVSEGRAIYLLHMSGEDILNMIESLPEIQSKLVLERLEIL